MSCVMQRSQADQFGRFSSRPVSSLPLPVSTRCLSVGFSSLSHSSPSQSTNRLSREPAPPVFCCQTFPYLTIYRKIRKCLTFSIKAIGLCAEKDGSMSKSKNVLFAAFQGLSISLGLNHLFFALSLFLVDAGIVTGAEVSEGWFLHYQVILWTLSSILLIGWPIFYGRKGT